MTQKQQVVSLELARELEKRGIVVESYWCWWETEDNDHLISYSEKDTHDVHGHYFAAPQTDELLAVLPKEINKMYFDLGYDTDGYSCDYEDLNGRTLLEDYSTYSDRLCNALAKLLIYLHDNQLLEKE